MFLISLVQLNTKQNNRNSSYDELLKLFFLYIKLVNLCILLVWGTSVVLFAGINGLAFKPSGFPNNIIMSFKAWAAFVLMTSSYLREKLDKSWKWIQPRNRIKMSTNKSLTTESFSRFHFGPSLQSFLPEIHFLVWGTNYHLYKEPFPKKACAYVCISWHHKCHWMGN